MKCDKAKEKDDGQGDKASRIVVSPPLCARRRCVLPPFSR